jgi:hypothetical protein
MSDRRPRTQLAGPTGSPGARAGGVALLVGLALADFAGHMLVSANYGYFRDELYYMEAGRHLAFGYVDFPPSSRSSPGSWTRSRGTPCGPYTSCPRSPPR